MAYKTEDNTVDIAGFLNASVVSGVDKKTVEKLLNSDSFRLRNGIKIVGKSRLERSIVNAAANDPEKVFVLIGTYTPMTNDEELPDIEL